MVQSLNGRLPTRADLLSGEKPKRARKPKPETPDPEPIQQPTPVAADPLMRWAHAGIGLSISLSAVLNGYANAQFAPHPLAGWALGVWVPVLVLVFARAAGVCYARGWRMLAYATGLVVLALLGLSVSHCARSFGAITGSDQLSSVLMSIGIDAGLVLCELMTVRRK